MALFFMRKTQKGNYMAVKTAQAIINGQTYTLTYNSSTKKYEATITAPNSSSYGQTGHYFPVTIKATDSAGNVKTVDSNDSSIGNSLRLVVKEKTPPTITIASPTSGALITNNKPAITFTIVDGDSGVNPDSVKLYIDSGSAITGDSLAKTAVANGYQFTYASPTSLADGSHTIKVDATDNDGNSATQKSSTFKIDTVPPVLSVSSPTNNLETNVKSVTVSGTTNDATSSPVTLTVNGEIVTVNENGAFSISVQLTEGSNTITVIAEDGAGKTSTVVRTVKLDTVAPVISNPTIAPNPVDAGGTVILSVVITD